MNRFSIRTLHDGAFRKTKRLLVKAHSSSDIGDREHRRHRAVLFLVERSNFFFAILLLS